MVSAGHTLGTNESHFCRFTFGGYDYDRSDSRQREVCKPPLWAILESSDSSDDAKQKAQSDLAALASNTLRRMAEIETASEAKVEDLQEPRAVAASSDTPLILGTEAEPEAA